MALQQVPLSACEIEVTAEGDNRYNVKWTHIGEVIANKMVDYSGDRTFLISQGINDKSLHLPGTEDPLDIKRMEQEILKLRS